MSSILDSIKDQQQKLTLEQQFQQYARPASNIFDFCQYVKIKDATTSRIIPYEDWSHLRLLLTAVLNKRLVVLLKSKQLGCSWTAAALHLWLCYKPATRVLCLSKGEDDAAELLDKSVFINYNLPSWLRLKTGNEGFRRVTFPDTSSEILALPSTEDAGAGYTASHTTRDELDLHKYAEQNFGNISPTIDAATRDGYAGASDLAMSTSKRIIPNSHFKTLYRNAKAKKNGYYPLFFPWYYQPYRDLEWYKKTRAKYYPLYLFEQAYPTTEEEALSAVEGLGLFERLILENLIEICHEPKRTPSAGVYLFHPFNSNCLYYAGGDAAEGRGGDYSTIWIEGTDGRRRWLAAVIHTNMLTPDLFALQAVDLMKQYNSPLLVMGNDAWGDQVLKQMVNLGYSERIYTPITNKKGKIGYTENEANKQTTLQEFSYAVRDGLIVEYLPAVEEMFGWNVENGKYISAYPHDDLVIAGAKANIAAKLTGDIGDVEVDNYA